MSLQTWIYIFAILILGSLLAVLTIPNQLPQAEAWFVFVVLLALAFLAQFFEAEAGRQSYYPHTAFFFAGVILLPPILFVLLIAIPHLAEWISKRLQKSPLLQNWYIQPFNIATHLIAGITTQFVYHSVSASMGAATMPPLFLSASPLIAAFSGISTYLLINHVLVGQALVLARGISWQASGVLNLENIVTEMIMASIGYVAATLWTINPWLLLPAVAPLLLIYRALMIPQLKKEAHSDAKTGLWNAGYFKKEFEDELARARRFGHPLALIMADLDLLRNINNTYGHLAGDVVIEGIAHLIRQNIRDYDIAARFGGEEFAIVLLEADTQRAVALAERLRQVVEAAEFDVPSSDSSIHATMSFGIACYPGDGEQPDEMIHEADIALYQAKFRGRNTVVTAADVPHSAKLAYAQSQETAKGNANVNPSTPAPAPLPPTSTSGSGSEGRPPDLHREQESSPGQKVSRGTDTTTPPIPEEATTAPESPATQRHQSAAPQTGLSALPLALQRLLFPSFLGSVILAAVLATGWGTYLTPRPDLLGIVTLVVLAILAELHQVQVYDNNSVSVSVAAAFAAAIIAGIPGVAIISTTITLIHYAKVRPAAYKSAFNWATHVLAGLPTVFLLADLHIPPTIDYLHLLLVLAVPAIMSLYLIETGLIATAIGLSTQTRILDQWREHFQWLAKNYLVLGIIGLFLAIAHTELGPIGTAVFALPAIMMHHTQKMYVERTESGVRELRRMNNELTQANREVTHANQAIQNLNDQLFLTLAKILDARDPYVSGHATQVAEYAVAIAARLSLSPQQTEQLRQAALLHDIGKLGIPEKILHKPASLTEEEYAIVKSHAALGAEFLGGIDGLRHLAPIVRHHHERWDGGGYPNGLTGADIPIESRILALCDAVEAMASDRPYQKAKSISEIVAEVHDNVGTQFDPEVARAFIQAAQEKGSALIVNSARAVDLQQKAMENRRQSTPNTANSRSSQGRIDVNPAWIKHAHTPSPSSI